MNIKEQRQAVRRMGKAIEKMPDKKREYILGFADGVLAMDELRNKNKEST